MDETPSAAARELRCICGAAVPRDLPPPGADPVRCTACGTPLVHPGSVPAARVNRAAIGAVVVGVACAIAWALLSSTTGSGLPLFVAFAGGLVGVAARAASRSRGGAVQLAALSGFLVFLLLGEMLLFRLALHPRLVAMHEREGAAEPAELASREIDRMRRLPLEKRVEHFLHIEATLALFVSLGVGAGLALLLTRSPPALAALRPPRPAPAPPPEPGASVETRSPETGVEDTGDTDDGGLVGLHVEQEPELPEITSDPMDVSAFVHPVEAEEPTYDLADDEEIARREAAARGDEEVTPPEDPR